MELFSPDSKSILFYENGALNFRDVLSHQINHSVDLSPYLDKGHNDFNYRISPDGKSMLLLRYNNAPLIIELSTGKEIQSIVIDDLEWALWGEFAADGKSVFVGGPYDWVYRWDLDQQIVLQKYCHPQWGFLRFAVTNDAKYLIGGGGWSEAGIWDIDTGERLYEIPSKCVLPQIGTVLILPGQQQVLICEGTVGLIVEIASGKVIRELTDTKNQTAGIYDAAVSPQSNILITNSPEKISEGDLWDARTFQHIRGLSVGQIPKDEWNICVSISPDGAFGLTINMHGTMHIWDLAKRSLLRSSKWYEHFISGG